MPTASVTFAPRRFRRLWSSSSTVSRGTLAAVAAQGRPAQRRGGAALVSRGHNPPLGEAIRKARSCQRLFQNWGVRFTVKGAWSRLRGLGCVASAAWLLFAHATTHPADARPPRRCCLLSQARLRLKSPSCRPPLSRATASSRGGWAFLGVCRGVMSGAPPAVAQAPALCALQSNVLCGPDARGGVHPGSIDPPLHARRRPV